MWWGWLALTVSAVVVPYYLLRSVKLSERAHYLVYLNVHFLLPQGPMKRLTILKSSNSAMRKMDETPTRRELRASELWPRGGRHCFCGVLASLKGCL